MVELVEPEEVAEKVKELRGKLRMLCTLVKAAEILNALKCPELAMDVLEVVDERVLIDKPLQILRRMLQKCTILPQTGRLERE